MTKSWSTREKNKRSDYSGHTSSGRISMMASTSGMRRIYLERMSERGPGSCHTKNPVTTFA